MGTCHLCASHGLSEVETHSEIEREMLGIIFALTRFHQYVLGRHVQAHTDHKPLVSVVKKSFDDIPPPL